MKPTFLKRNYWIWIGMVLFLGAISAGILNNATTVHARDLDSQRTPDYNDAREQMRDPALNPIPAPRETNKQLVTVPCGVPLPNMSGIYECDKIDFNAFVPTNQLSNGITGNDVWGWKHEASGREFAFMGHSLSTSFIEITDPDNPIYLGSLPTHGFNGGGVNALWRDMKVYQDHLYIVADFQPGAPHGMQIIELTQLLTATPIPIGNPTNVFVETAHYAGDPNGTILGDAHNVAINEESGYAYIVGGNVCNGGLHMVNIQDPANPVYAGCFSEDGYTHDVQCVNYHGPDPDYQGREICMAANDDTLTVVDVTDKANPVMLARETYFGLAYSHQGWLTEDHSYFLLGDEQDETNLGVNTRTFIWDVRDLDVIVNTGFYESPNSISIDHNLYVNGGLVYEANYSDGLRVLDVSQVRNGDLTEVAYFDTAPGVDVNQFEGAWNVYPYFESGTLVLSSLNDGLFLLTPQLPNLAIDISEPAGILAAGETLIYTVTVTNTGNIQATDTLVTAHIDGQDIALGTLSTLAVGETVGLVFTYDIPLAVSCDSLVADATASSAEGVTATTLQSVVSYLNGVATTNPQDIDITQMGSDVMLDWVATSASSYQVWEATNNPYLNYGPNCGVGIFTECAELVSNTHMDGSAIGDVANNNFYLVLGVNACGEVSNPDTIQRVGEFDFAIEPGSS